MSLLFFLIPFILSAFFSFFIIRVKPDISIDTSEGVQKVHSGKVPRIGGVAIYLAMWSIGFFFYKSDFHKEFLPVLISTVPVFLGGFIEDITKKIGPRERLILAFISGLLAVFLSGANLHRVDIPFIDYLLSTFFIFSALFTAFAVAGVSNAINIIDGFNGLASGITLLVFLTYAYVSYKVGDMFVLHLSLCTAGAISGFFIFNFPLGKIFLGDGGAYLLGFLAALTGVLLVNRNPEVSAWFPFLILIYPVWETVYSIIRRKFFQKLPPFYPDKMHIHTLIYRRFIKKRFFKLTPSLKNSLTSLPLIIIQMLLSFMAILFYSQTLLLFLLCVTFIMAYRILYKLLTLKTK